MKKINERIKIAIVAIVIVTALITISSKAHSMGGATAVIDQEVCIGCETCIEILPQYIQLNEDGKAEFTEDNINIEYAFELIRCVAECPTGAISIIGTY